MEMFAKNENFAAAIGDKTLEFWNTIFLLHATPQEISHFYGRLIA